MLSLMTKMVSLTTKMAVGLILESMIAMTPKKKMVGPKKKMAMKLTLRTMIIEVGEAGKKPTTKVVA